MSGWTDEAGDLIGAALQGGDPFAPPSTMYAEVCVVAPSASDPGTPSSLGLIELDLVNDFDIVSHVLTSLAAADWGNAASDDGAIAGVNLYDDASKTTRYMFNDAPGMLGADLNIVTGKRVKIPIGSLTFPLVPGA
jgi:hypothetical protein